MFKTNTTQEPLSVCVQAKSGSAQQPGQFCKTGTECWAPCSTAKTCTHQSSCLVAEDSAVKECWPSSSVVENCIAQGPSPFCFMTEASTTQTPLPIFFEAKTGDVNGQEPGLFCSIPKTGTESSCTVAGTLTDHELQSSSFVVTTSNAQQPSFCPVAKTSARAVTTTGTLQGSWPTDPAAGTGISKQPQVSCPTTDTSAQQTGHCCSMAGTTQESCSEVETKEAQPCPVAETIDCKQIHFNEHKALLLNALIALALMYICLLYDYIYSY